MVDIEKLRALKALLDNGTLTEKEFEEAKAKLLAASTDDSGGGQSSADSTSNTEEGDDTRSSGDSDSSAPSSVVPQTSDVTPETPGTAQVQPGGLLVALGALALAVGLFLLVYRVMITVYILYLGTLVSACCCGLIDPDEITGGFGGAWKAAGKAFSETSGDTFAQIIYFGSSDGATMFAYIAIGGGLLVAFIGAALNSSK